MTKIKRKYTHRTLKILFGRSGNQCAEPECINQLIEPSTQESDALVSGHICHIYPVSDNGPRGKPGLTERQLNAPENLILLCRHHHAIVDGQYETYPAKMLKLWKSNHEATIQRRLNSESPNTKQDVFSHSYFPKDLVDQKIEQELALLQKARFSEEFDRIQFPIMLAKKLMKEELSGGARDIRCRALAWCARVLSYSEQSNLAEEFLDFSMSLGDCPEIEVAKAFLDSAKGEKKAALTALADIAPPMSRTAALQVVLHHDDPQVAVDWLKNAGLTDTDLDSDGKLVLLSLHHELSDWDAAKECVKALTDADFDAAPLLHHMVALTHLVSTVPNELRSFVLTQVPFEVATFPLASDANAIKARRMAQKAFIRAAEILRELKSPKAGQFEDEYILWLELRDPDYSANGCKHLEDKLRDKQSILRFVHLGMQFGIELDLEAVNREIERQIALNGGITADTARARFALAFAEKSPQDFASYIARYRDELFEKLDKKSIISLEIEMLSRSGFPERAKECLTVLIAEGISEGQISHLQRIISEADGIDSIEARKEQFKKTNRLADLTNLVNELEIRSEWSDLCEYGAILFKRTGSLDDAVRLAKALSNIQNYGRLVEFIQVNSSLLRHSDDLRMLYCWSLYFEGALLDARTELTRLNGNQDNSNYRALQVNLGITLGDWNSLLELVAQEFREKDKRSAAELMNASQLGFHLGSPNAKHLLFAAARKGKEDAGILIAAYSLASSAGWEGDVEVCQWLSKAVELSNDDGPVQKMSLKEMVDQKPDWDLRTSDTWLQLSQGKIPMFVAGYLLNKSLIDFVLFPAFTNVVESDPRLRAMVPTFSGGRQPKVLALGGALGIEVTALLTLGISDLLDYTFDAFDKVVIPHSTLAWLFDEKQKASFHQPSRIKYARQLCELLVNKDIEELKQTTVSDGDLSAKVGDELALLIAEAERVSDEGEPQQLVVQPAPVHRVGSFMEEEADLSAYANVISSCQSIVEELRQQGQITAAEEAKAIIYLQLHEKPWPMQPAISNGAVLYLDDLAVTYFLHLGILGKLKTAGFRTIILPSVVIEANQLICYERFSSQVNNVIEKLRSTLNIGIESGKVMVCKNCQKKGDVNDNPMMHHPTLDILELAAHSDAVITDDRFFNQYLNLVNGDKSTPTFTILDLIDQFSIGEKITSEQRLEKRTYFRRRGYFFVPVSGDELQHHLETSTVVKGKLNETAELKAIRENILQVRMSKWLQLPQEVFWLDSLIKTLIQALHDQWRTEADLTTTRARSAWILKQIDIRGWAHCLNDEAGANIVKTGRIAHILLLLSPPADVLPAIKEDYWSWIEENCLASIKEQEPELYALMLAWTRDEISKIAKMDLTEKGATSSYTKAALAQMALELSHPLLRESLLEDSNFREKYGFTVDAVLSFRNSDASFQRSHLLNAVRKSFSNSSAMGVVDIEGNKWKLKTTNGEGKAPNWVLERGKQRLFLPDCSVLSMDCSLRLSHFGKVASDVNLPCRERDLWQGIFKKRPLTNEEFDAFHGEFQDTPVEKSRSILSNITNGNGSISSLVPNSRKYFERLVGVYDESVAIGDYAVGGGKIFFRQLSAWQPYDGFLFSLLLTSHSSLTVEINVDLLSDEELQRSYEFLEQKGDILSQMGAIEVGLRILSDRPAIEKTILRLIEKIRDDDVEGEASNFQLFSALFVLVDGELSRTRLFSTEPPFYRRLAALSHAALIHRQFEYSAVDIDHFSKSVMNNRGQQFYLQSLTDMRSEPRWNPGYASASQLKAEFFGRIMIAAKKYEGSIKTRELRKLVLGTESASLHCLGGFPAPYLPGPLEGADNFKNLLPTEITEAIKTQLGSKKVQPDSFNALINSSLIFHIDGNQAAMAANVLKLANYRLSNIEERSHLIIILNGLATVSAITRSQELADKLRILVRRYRRDTEFALSCEEAMLIGLMTAASHSDLKNWSVFVGDWLTELAFDDLKKDEIQMFYSHLKWLCHVVPELWITCGRAIAALESIRK